MVPESNDDKRGGKVISKQATPKTSKKVAKKKVAKKKVARKTTVRKAAPPKARASQTDVQQISAKERYQMIARMAYFRAEKRNFEPGWEQQDWFESEKMVDEMLNRVFEGD